MKTICLYRFPCHPQEMIRNSTVRDQNKRMVRLQAIKMISELSQEFTQTELDNKIYVDVKGDDIVGFDFSELFGMNELRSMCVGNRQVSLINLTARNWCDMRI